MTAQELIVFGLFIAIIAYYVYRIFFKKKKSKGCASCEYNPENQ